MPTIKEVVTIEGHDRAFELTVHWPTIGRSAVNLQEIAQTAWLSPDKAVEVDGVKVKVRELGRAR
ncbi:MAG: hypothetical protein AB7S92_24960 [Parvibaculaceae bacterium]